MLLTLIKALDTTDLFSIVKGLSLSVLDIDLLLYEAEKKGEIKVDKKKHKVRLLVEPENLHYDTELAHKIVAMIKQYDEQDSNVTFGRLKGDTVIDPQINPFGYPAHEFICTMYALEQGAIFNISKPNRYEISVPEIKKVRPYNKFVFYTYLDHQEFGAKAVNKYIDQFSRKKVK